MVSISREHSLKFQETRQPRQEVGRSTNNSAYIHTSHGVGYSDKSAFQSRMRTGTHIQVRTFSKVAMTPWNYLHPTSEIVIAAPIFINVLDGTLRFTGLSIILFIYYYFFKPRIL